MASVQRVTKTVAPAIDSKQVAGKTIEHGYPIPERKIATGPWKEVAIAMDKGDSVGDLERNQANSLGMKLRSIGKRAVQRSEGEGKVRLFVVETGLSPLVKKVKPKVPKAVAAPVHADEPEDEEEVEDEDDLDADE